ncbi:MAG: ClpXP protease specificity-enhancing factor SspB [Leptospiraceae bacterium]|nr:ClpXP protease specificity-enhancing factor SspB [Leptospiraceae bacterium]MDW7976051.1 hypothetical protein [Leptospiraceae bacterium]
MDRTFTEEDLQYNRSLKKAIFEVLLEKTETFYLHCMMHSRLSTGDRKFTEKEIKEGIIFVLGPYSYRKLSWDEKGISCEMNFGKWETVYIPYECIFRIFDKGGHFLMQFVTMDIDDDVFNDEEKESTNVIPLDFSKNKKKEKKEES